MQDEMLFKFEQYYRGWYPAQLGKLQEPIGQFATTNEHILFHDFVDHGPHADFSVENEALAAGSSYWTKSGTPILETYLGYDFDLNALLELGQAWSRQRFPNGVRMVPDFGNRIGILLDEQIELKIRNIKSAFDIILFADNLGNVDFRRA